MIPGIIPIVANSGSGAEGGAALVLGSTEHHSSGGVGSGLTKSWALPSGTDFLVAIVGSFNNDSLNNVVSCTWNGVAMASARSEQLSAGSRRLRLTVFYLANPDGGTLDAVASFTNSSAGALILVGLQGIKQTSPVNVSTGNTDLSATKNISNTTTARSMRIYGRFEDDTVSFTSGGTELQDVNGDMGSINAAITAAYYLEDAASSYNFTSEATDFNNAGAAIVAAFELV